jgi:hypothetical protein
MSIYDGMLEGLKNAHIRTHPITEFLTDYRSDPARYAISPFDQHPNAKANNLIAEGIVEKILEARVSEGDRSPKVE